MNRVVIAGTKGSFDEQLFTLMVGRALRAIDEQVEVVIRDENSQVDRMALRMCSTLNIPVIRMQAFWKKEGFEAGLKRNEHLALSATHAIVFWDGFSKDIRDLLHRLSRYKVKTKLVITEFQ